MVWPTLGSRKAKEQNRTIVAKRSPISAAAQHLLRYAIEHRPTDRQTDKLIAILRSPPEVEECVAVFLPSRRGTRAVTADDTLFSVHHSVQHPVSGITYFQSFTWTMNYLEDISLGPTGANRLDFWTGIVPFRIQDLQTFYTLRNHMPSRRFAPLECFGFLFRSRPMESGRPLYFHPVVCSFYILSSFLLA